MAEIKLNKYNSTLFHTENRHVCLMAEFRSGKTTAFNLKIRKYLNNYPVITIAVIRNQHDDLKKSTIPQFKGIYDWDLTGEKYNKQDKTLFCRNKSILHFIALDRPDDTRKLKNIELGAFFVDQVEEIHPDVWDMAQGRCSQKGMPNKGTGAGNPKGKNWVYYRFFAKPDETWTGEFTKGDVTRKRDYGYYCGEQGEKFIGIWPEPFLNEQNLPANYYDDQVRTHSTDWNDQYMFAMFKGNAGLIHNDYNEMLHRLSFDKYIEEKPWHWNLYEGMDYGVSNPTCWLWAWHDRESDIIYFVDEYYIAGKSIDFHKPNILTKRRGLGGDPIYTIGCPRTFQRESKGEAPSDEYQRNGIHILPYPVGVNARIEICNRRFRQNKIVIYDRCHNLLRQVESMRWEDLKKSNQEDHALEAFQRLVAKIDKGTHSADIGETQELNKDAPATMTAGIMSEQF